MNPGRVDRPDVADRPLSRENLRSADQVRRLGRAVALAGGTAALMLEAPR